VPIKLFLSTAKWSPIFILATCLRSQWNILIPLSFYWTSGFLRLHNQKFLPNTIWQKKTYVSLFHSGISLRALNIYSPAGPYSFTRRSKGACVVWLSNRPKGYHFVALRYWKSCSFSFRLSLSLSNETNKWHLLVLEHLFMAYWSLPTRWWNLRNETSVIYEHPYLCIMLFLCSIHWLHIVIPFKK